MKNYFTKFIHLFGFLIETLYHIREKKQMKECKFEEKEGKENEISKTNIQNHDE